MKQTLFPSLHPSRFVIIAIENAVNNKFVLCIKENGLFFSYFITEEQWFYKA